MRYPFGRYNKGEVIDYLTQFGLKEEDLKTHSKAWLADECSNWCISCKKERGDGGMILNSRPLCQECYEIEKKEREEGRRR